MTGYEIDIYKAGGGYLQFNSLTVRVVDSSVLFDWQENGVSQLSFSLSNLDSGADNFLNGGFNLWLGGSYTGPLLIGQRVEYWVWSTIDPTSRQLCFMGFIVDMQLGTDGVLNIVCKDDLYKAEEAKVAKTVFNLYTDSQGYYRDSSGGIYRIGGAAVPSDIVMPPVQVLNGNNDMEEVGTHIAGGDTPNANSGTELNAAGRKVVQALGPHDIVGWIRVHVKVGATNTADLKYSIQTDSAGYPSGTIVGGLYGTKTEGAGSGAWFTEVFVPTTTTYDRLSPSARYWVVFEPVGNTTTVDIQIGCDSKNGYIYPDHQYYNGTWYTVTGSCLLLDVYYADYDEVAPSSTYYSGGYIYMPSITTPTGAAGGVGNTAGGASFYRGTVDLETIMETLASIAGFSPIVDASCDRTFGLYRTRGRSILECLKELADVFENSGGWSGYQHTLVPWWDSGNLYLYVKRRTALSEASYRTFANALEAATDDEAAITNIDLRKMVKLRPSTVMVIGKDNGGRALIRSYDDRGLGAASFRTLSGVPLTYTEYDESLVTMAEVDKKASTLMQSFARDAWEGRITLSGLYPELRDFSNSSVTFGSGKIITLSWAPLGISNTKFKVKGLRMTRETTEVQITNADTLLDNKLTRGMSTAYKSESFLTPDDPQTDFYFSCWENAVPGSTTLTMTLNKSGYTAIDGLTGVACSCFIDTALNMRVYHAEFEMNNGHTTSGTDKVTAISLWVGGTEYGRYTLSTAEQFDKWKTTRVIVEYKTKNA